MLCQDIESCCEEIRNYGNRPSTGYPLVVDAENYDDYQQLLSRLRSDLQNQLVYVSSYCLPDGLPQVREAMRCAFAGEHAVLVGVSQACMLRSKEYLWKELDVLLGSTIPRHTIILLDHCKVYLQHHLQQDLRLKNRILLVAGSVQPLPQICLLEKDEEWLGLPPLSNIQQLLSYLEQLTEAERSRKAVIPVVTKFPVYLFASSLYAMNKAGNVYDMLRRNYPDLSGTEEGFGSQEEWCWLAGELKEKGSFTQVVVNHFLSCENLDLRLAEMIKEKDAQRRWLYWLALKVIHTRSAYLEHVVSATKQSSELEHSVYFCLLEKDSLEKDFADFYEARRKLLEKMPENLQLTTKYCNAVGQKDRDGIRYLTDRTEREGIQVVKYLSRYIYTREEILDILQSVSPELACYMGTWTFEAGNTQLAASQSAWRDRLTRYFVDYRWQKLCNRIEPAFLSEVEAIAEERPYNLLLPRIRVIKDMDCRNAQPYFFDALGVEYLAYIQSKCEEYGMQAEIHVGHCDLPSITSCNKEFIDAFALPCRNIKELDNLKHDAQKFNYEKEKTPIHLLKELEVINQELRRIHSELSQGHFEKAMLISDHGASRLAVIHECESAVKLSLQERGQHSGRCCPVVEDPGIPFAAYENGYSILANYDRFKGSRKADVEVHGGASLEEVLVPVIALTMRPDTLEYKFCPAKVQWVRKESVKLTLFCNRPMKKPRICVNGEYFEGMFTSDNQHAMFVLASIRRKGTYLAEIYEGSMATGITLEFNVQKNTHEKDFGL